MAKLTWTDQGRCCSVATQLHRPSYIQREVPLLIGNGGGMSLDYWMHHPRDRWQVYDLSVNGISLVASYRSQFNQIVRTDSYEGLVARLKSRQVGFAAPAAGSSGGKPAR